MPAYWVTSEVKMVLSAPLYLIKYHDLLGLKWNPSQIMLIMSLSLANCGQRGLTVTVKRIGQPITHMGADPGAQFHRLIHHPADAL